MVKHSLALAGLLAFALNSNAAFIFNDAGSTAIPGNNDFKTDLESAGFDSMVTGEQLSISQTGTITFRFIGSESGFTNSFNLAGAAFFTEQQQNYIPLNLSGYDTGNGVEASVNVTANDIINFSFTSSNGNALTPVDNFNSTNLQGLGIVFDGGLSSLNQVVLAYDDQSVNDDDNGDDMLILATFTPIPVPAAAWLFGSALVGLAGIKRK